MSERDEIKKRLQRIAQRQRWLQDRESEGRGVDPIAQETYLDLKWLEEQAERLETPMSVLEEADDITGGARRKAYQHPSVDFECTASLMTAVLRRAGALRPSGRIDAALVPVLMMCVKLSRLSGNLEHRDSLVDIAGYARTLEMLIDQRKLEEDL